jgi:hypothetical protein
MTEERLRESVARSLYQSEVERDNHCADTFAAAAKTWHRIEPWEECREQFENDAAAALTAAASALGAGSVGELMRRFSANEPPGCPTPGACSCLANDTALRSTVAEQAEALEVLAEKAKGAFIHNKAVWNVGEFARAALSSAPPASPHTENSVPANADRGRQESDALEVERLKTALRRCARNDATAYDHHDPRRWDGKKPGESVPPGSIWLTPREIARAALKEPDLATFSDKEADNG